MGTMPSPLNIVTMMAHSPPIVAPAVDLGMTILTRLRISPRRREILVLLVAARTDCAYLRTQHVPMARSAGVTEDEVEAIIERPGDFSAFAPAERALLQAGDELLGSANLRASTVQDLLEHHGLQEIVEVFFVVGNFRSLAGMMNGLDIDIDPAGDRFATVSSTPAGPEGTGRG
jgi:4-carboxymuconolactone decarboxylase